MIVKSPLRLFLSLEIKTNKNILKRLVIFIMRGCIDKITFISTVSLFLFELCRRLVSSRKGELQKQV